LYSENVDKQKNSEQLKSKYEKDRRSTYTFKPQRVTKDNPNDNLKGEERINKLYA
jgi:hypothetical protein